MLHIMSDDAVREAFQNQIKHDNTVPKVYTASKLGKASYWKNLSIAWHGRIEFISRWIHYVGIIADSPENAAQFWKHNMEDICKADYVIVYGTDEDRLRGALVEAGMAIMSGKKVIVVGDHSDYGTWKYIRGVRHFGTMPVALNFILKDHQKGYANDN